MPFTFNTYANIHTRVGTVAERSVRIKFVPSYLDLNIILCIKDKFSFNLLDNKDVFTAENNLHASLKYPDAMEQFLPKYSRQMYLAFNM